MDCRAPVLFNLFPSMLRLVEEFLALYRHSLDSMFVVGTLELELFTLGSIFLLILLSGSLGVAVVFKGFGRTVSFELPQSVVSLLVGFCLLIIFLLKSDLTSHIFPFDCLRRSIIYQFFISYPLL